MDLSWYVEQSWPETGFKLHIIDRWITIAMLFSFQAHLAPESETRFDFQKYISRSLEEDFVVVVGITLVFFSI